MTNGKKTEEEPVISNNQMNQTQTNGQIYEEELELKERLIQTYILVSGLIVAGEKVKDIPYLNDTFFFFIFASIAYYTLLSLKNRLSQINDVSFSPAINTLAGMTSILFSLMLITALNETVAIDKITVFTVTEFIVILFITLMSLIFSPKGLELHFLIAKVFVVILITTWLIYIITNWQNIFH
jgi:hypothetical protein